MDRGASIALVGGAVALPVIVARLHLDGGKAGAANDAAADALGEVDGVSFDVPDNHSMVDAWRSMKAALAASPAQGVSNNRARAVRSAWLSAYQAGASADPVNFALYGSNDAVGADAELSPLGSLTSLDLCSGDVPFVRADGPWQPLGRAVCALQSATFNATSADFDRAITLAGAVAQAMDDADFRRDGDRRSDRYAAPSIVELPGRVASWVAGKLADAVLPSPVTLALLVGGGYLVWRKLR